MGIGTEGIAPISSSSSSSSGISRPAGDGYAAVWRLDGDLNDSGPDLLDLMVAEGPLRFLSVAGVRGLWSGDTPTVVRSQIEPQVQLAGDLTLCWRMDVQPDSFGYILSIKGDGADEQSNTLLSLQLTAGMELGYRVEYGAASPEITSFGVIPQGARWFCLTRQDNGGLISTLALYIDGEPFMTLAGILLPSGGADARLYLGARDALAPNVPTRLLRTSLADVTLEATALTEEQVRARYQQLHGGA